MSHAPDRRQQHERCICDVARQFFHPEKGVAKGYEERPTSFKEWFTFLSNAEYGWINAGVEETVGEHLRRAGLGEVIPNTNPDLSLFKRSFFTQVVLDRLRPVDPDGNPYMLEFRVVMNYGSFMKLVQLIMSDLPSYSRDTFRADFQNWNQTITPRVFWVNFLIPKQIATLLQQNHVGEVITKQGYSTFFNFLPTNTLEKEETDPEYGEEDEKKIRSILESKTEEDGFRFTRDESFFRVIMNQYTIQRLFQTAIGISVHAGWDKFSQTHMVHQLLAQNAFEFFGGEMADMMSEFAKLQF
jgi:hypothetical protein